MKKNDDVLLNDKFCSYNNMEVVFAKPGRARVRMGISEHHKNGYGMAHGGAIFTLADFAFAAASNAGDEIVVSINASVSFIKAAKEGIIFAEAIEVARSSKLVNYEVKVTNPNGEVLAVFQGVGYIKKSG